MARSIKTRDLGKLGGKFVTLHGKRMVLPKGVVIKNFKISPPVGVGSRLQYKYKSHLMVNPRLISIYQKQVRQERKYGVRVKNGLFDDPLSDNPKLIGVVKVQRRKQQNPHSGKRPTKPRQSSSKNTKKRHAYGMHQQVNNPSKNVFRRTRTF